MSTRAWLALSVLALSFGVICGWAARVQTADHRYIRALAERHEAEASFFNKKLDKMVQDNERRYGK